MNDGTPLVHVQHVTKRFGKCTALDDVSLAVPAGRIVGLLGANGAGKSTLLRHMVGMYLPDAGSCLTFGCEARQLRPEHLARLGYVHQDGDLLDWMTAGQLIRYVRSYYPTWNEALERKYVADFEIDEKVRVAALSPGQRQRLAILLAIGCQPELLILDEPAAALDPLARMQFLDLLTAMIQDTSRTILISSHILGDVEKVIDHVVIMDRGRILRDCGLDALQEEFCRLRLTAPEGRLPESLPFTGVIESRRGPGEALLTLRRPPAEELRSLEQHHRWHVEVQALPLEELYRLVVQGQAK